MGSKDGYADAGGYYEKDPYSVPRYLEPVGYRAASRSGPDTFHRKSRREKNNFSVNIRTPTLQLQFDVEPEEPQFRGKITNWSVVRAWKTIEDEEVKGAQLQVVLSEEKVVFDKANAPYAPANHGGVRALYGAAEVKSVGKRPFFSRVRERLARVGRHEPDFMLGHKKGLVDPTPREFEENEPAPGEASFRWIHICEATRMSLENLHFALGEIMRTEQKTKALLHTLLEKVKPFEKTYVHGRYLEPTVVRVTGKDVDDSKAPKTMRAIFINYPYFALDKIQETKTLKKGGAHPPRSLLQAHFRLSSTKDRDELQVVRNVTKGKDSRILYVPQVWSILLEHEMIITYSCLSQEELHDSCIAVERSGVFQGPLMILFHLFGDIPLQINIKDCATWIDFIKTIEIRSGRSVTFDSVTDSKGVVITAAEWPDFIANEKVSIIELYPVIRNHTTANEARCDGNCRNYYCGGECKGSLAKDTRTVASDGKSENADPSSPSDTKSTEKSRVYSAPISEEVRAEASRKGQSVQENILAFSSEYPGSAKRNTANNNTESPVPQILYDFGKPKLQSINTDYRRQDTLPQLITTGSPHFVLPEVHYEQHNYESNSGGVYKYGESLAGNIPAPRTPVLEEAVYPGSSTESLPQDPQPRGDSGPAVQVISSDDNSGTLSPPRTAYPAELNSSSLLEEFTPEIEGAARANDVNVMFSPAESDHTLRNELPAPVQAFSTSIGSPSDRFAWRTESDTIRSASATRARSENENARIGGAFINTFKNILGSNSHKGTNTNNNTEKGGVDSDEQASSSTTTFLLRPMLPSDESLYDKITFILPPKRSDVPYILQWPHKRSPTRQSDEAKKQTADPSALSTNKGRTSEKSTTVSEKKRKVDDIARMLTALNDRHQHNSNENFTYNNLFIGHIYCTAVTERQSAFETAMARTIAYRRYLQKILGREKPSEAQEEEEKGEKKEDEEETDEKAFFRGELEYLQLIEEVVLQFIDVLQLFAPLQFEHELHDKVWGALKTLISAPFCVRNFFFFKTLKRTLQQFGYLIFICDSLRSRTKSGEEAEFLYVLPSGFVKAFGDIVLFLVWSARTFPAQQVTNEDQDPGRAMCIVPIDRSSALTPETQSYFTLQVDIYRSIQSGVHDLMNMAATSSNKWAVYEPVGCYEFLAIILKNLESSRKFRPGGFDDIADMYNYHVQNQHLKLLEHPTRHILQKLNLAADELVIVERIMKERIATLTDWLSKIPTDYIVYSRYNPEKTQAVGELIDGTIDTLDKIKEVQGQVEYLQRQTVQLVDLKSEDQNIAIFIFTFVTIVFLPLSFVTSFFGMNTSDIRDMPEKVERFWNTSIPLTVVIVVFAVVVAIWGNSLYIKYTEFRMKMRERRGKLGNGGNGTLKVD